MATLTYEERTLKIAKEILSIRPGIHLKAALREAKAIAKIRDTYQVSAEQKNDVYSKVSRNSLPEHVKATISKQKNADAERRRAGRKSVRIKIISGGAVSPK